VVIPELVARLDPVVLRAIADGPRTSRQDRSAMVMKGIERVGERVTMDHMRRSEYIK